MTACGGGGGGGSSGSATAPAATIRFPTATAWTDAGSITVRGTASAASGIRNVMVNGLAASTTDGFATWSSRVPLASGDNMLTVEVVGAGGRRTRQAAVAHVQRQSTTMTRPTGMDLDSADTRLVVIDGETQDLLSVDLATGMVTVAATQDYAGSPSFEVLEDVAIGPTGTLAYAVDAAQRAVFEVMLGDGSRRIHSSNTVGAGTPFQQPTGIALDAGGTQLLVTDAGQDALLGVDLAVGNRVVLSKAGVRGNGPAFSSPAGIAVDAVGQRWLVIDAGVDALFSVDMLTGDRTVLSGYGLRGNGPAWRDPRDVRLADDRLSAYVTERGSASIERVDLTTGNRTDLTSMPYGIGTALEMPSSLVLRNDGDVLFSDTGTGALVTLSLQTGTMGERSNTVRVTTGTGEPLRFPNGGVFDSARHRVLIADSTRRQIVAVDLATGDRSVLSSGESGSEVGQGPAFLFPLAVALDPADRLLVTDRAALVAVDLVTGDRTVIASSSVGSGASFNGTLTGVDVDATRNLAIVTTLQFLYRVDLATGTRAALTGSFTNAVDVAADPEHGEALVLDRGSRAIYRVDLNTGNRITVSDNNTSTAAPFADPNGIAYDAGRQRILVANGSSTVLAVDPITGMRSELSGTSTGDGVELIHPLRVDVTPTGQIMVVDDALRGILAIEPDSGDRVLTSR